MTVLVESTYDFSSVLGVCPVKYFIEYPWKVYKLKFKKIKTVIFKLSK